MSTAAVAVIRLLLLLSNSQFQDRFHSVETSEKMSKNDDPFSSKRASQLFLDCVLEDGSICIDTYVEGYYELIKMYNLLGKVFGFVGILMHKDLKLLLSYQQTESGEHYKTLQAMIAHEKVTKDPKGSKIFRRFHYTLEFMAELLDKLNDVDRQAGLAGKTLEIYHSKLAGLQPWWLQKASSVALQTLPTKMDFIRKLHPSIEDPHDMAVMEAKEGAINFKKLFDICEVLFIQSKFCLLYTSPSPRDRQKSRMPSSA